MYRKQDVLYSAGNIAEQLHALVAQPTCGLRRERVELRAGVDDGLAVADEALGLLVEGESEAWGWVGLGFGGVGWG